MSGPTSPAPVAPSTDDLALRFMHDRFGPKPRLGDMEVDWNYLKWLVKESFDWYANRGWEEKP